MFVMCLAHSLRMAYSPFLTVVNICFANPVLGIRRTACSGSKKIRSTCSGNIRPVRRTQLILNRANFCFGNLVLGIRRTAKKLCSGSEKLRSTCSGNIRPIRRTLPPTAWSKELSCG